LEYTIERRTDQLALVRVAGRIDAKSADEFKGVLKNATNEGLCRLVVDLHAVTFIDSSGLSALVSGFRAAHECNGAMFLAQVGPQVKIALELTRLSQVFRVFNDVDSALAELAN